MKKNFSRAPHVIDIRKRQEGDVAPFLEVAVDLVGQLLLIVDRKDQGGVETLFGPCRLSGRRKGQFRVAKSFLIWLLGVVKLLQLSLNCRRDLLG